MAGNNRFSVRELITNGNIDELEVSVLQGYGDRLLGETSQAPLVQEFLDNLPCYLDQIAELHRSSARGNVREFQQLLDRPSLILSRDPLGATPLHKAVLNGHTDLVEYIVTNYGTSALDAKDNVSQKSSRMLRLLLTLSLCVWGHFDLFLFIFSCFSSLDSVFNLLFLNNWRSQSNFLFYSTNF